MTYPEFAAARKLDAARATSATDARWRMRARVG